MSDSGKPAAASAPIVAVTPNPSVDRVAVVPGFAVGHIHRPAELFVVAGGKGVNAARAATCLGHPAEAALLLGGYRGQWMEAELAQEGIATQAAWVDGETRTCLTIVDGKPEPNVLTALYENGPSVSGDAWGQFKTLIEAMIGEGVWVMISGSLPPGVPTGGYAELLEITRSASASTLVDTHGAYLHEALRCSPRVVKINAEEAGEVLGVEIDGRRDAVEAARSLCDRGASTAVVTLGRKGAVWADDEGALVATPPPTEAVAPVGSGDAFLGAVAVALAEERSAGDALRLGVAAGAANASTLVPGKVDRDQVRRLAKQAAVWSYEGGAVRSRVGEQAP